jgi:nucleoside-diphosphate-sugar epimerase
MNGTFKKKILICGATGFIGRNMAEFFMEKENFEVFGTYLNGKPLDNPKIKMIKADLTNEEDVDRAVKGMDIIVQAAATTSGAKDIVERPYYHVTDNAIMNSLIFRTAYENDISHVIFFSCTVMYQSSENPVKESDFDANQEIYPYYFGVGWTKVYTEKMCEFYSRIGNTKYTVIRHSNIYGPYDKFDLEKSHVLGATITKVMTTKDGAKITIWGTGEEKRDLLYISDLVNFVELAINKQKSKFELYNVGSGASISVIDLVKKIISLSNKDIKIEYDDSKPTIKTKLCLDTSKAKNSLGWFPKVSLDEGIKSTMNWYKTNIKIL